MPLNKIQIIERLIEVPEKSPPAFFKKQMKMLNTLCKRYSMQFMSVVSFNKKFDSLEVLISPALKSTLDKKFKAFNFKVDFSKYPKYNLGRKSGKDANIIKRKKSIKDFLDE